MIAIRSLELCEAGIFAGMTFESYQPMLAGSDDGMIVVRLGAWLGDQPAGLALGALPAPDQDAAPTLFSLFVVPECRHNGIGSALMRGFLDAVGVQGGTEVRTIFMDGKDAIQWFRRILVSTGWGEPVHRMTAIRTDMQRLRTANPPWLRQRRIPSSRFHIIPWHAVTNELKQQLRASHDRDAWIPSDLLPWAYEKDYDRATSCALLRDGVLASWVINHLMPDGTTRYTCSFAHPKIQRYGAIFWLYHEAAARMDKHGRNDCMWTVPVQHESMHSFAMRWMAPCAHSVRRTYGVSRWLKSED